MVAHRVPVEAIDVCEHPGVEMAADAGTGRARVNDQLVAAGRPLSVQEVADGTGLHVNTVREHLERLVAEGVATRSVPATGRPGRPRVTYAAVDQGAGDRREYHALAGLLTEHLVGSATRPDEAARQIGRRWGRRIVQTNPAPQADVVLEVREALDTHGFAPSEAGDVMRLGNCPFKELAEQRPQVLCSLHQGMVCGMVEERGADDVRVEVRPFTQSGACEVHLHRRSSR